MTRRIVKALRNPSIAISSAYGKFIASFVHRTYSFANDYRSSSENGMYVRAIEKALARQREFNKFKRHPHYSTVLEHVSYEQGLAYLDVLRGRDDGFLEKALETVLVGDSIGNPRKSSFDGFEMLLSPTTLRYVKVASDINFLFDGELNKTVEIGCGYGGQCLVNDQLLNIKSATLFDLPIVNKLIERYLECFLLNGSYVTSTINNLVDSSYDLVISNYAFSELPRSLQIKYIEKVLSSSEKGYLTMNSGRGGAFDLSSSKLSIDELEEMLPPFEVMEEHPLTYEHNYIIVWGHKYGINL